MLTDVAIKARLEDLAVFHTHFKKVYELKDDACKTFVHCDTFFKCNNGRIKLREIKGQDDETVELIYYDRADVAGPRKTKCICYSTRKDGAALKDVLTQAYGKRGEVKKTRLLYNVEQTRIHIDEVEGVGSFMELEVVLRDDQTEEDGKKIAEEFMEKLNITPDMLVNNSYIDLLVEARVAGAKENGTASQETDKPEKADLPEDKEMEEIAQVPKEVEESAPTAEKAEAVIQNATEPSETKEATKEDEKAPASEAPEAIEADKPVEKANEVKEIKDQAKGDAAEAKEMNGDKTEDTSNDAEKMDTDEAAAEKGVETKAPETSSGEVAVDTNTEA
ncbi:hypothetical protein BIW11_07714 [Tropilaelaps mercedesae]|uniref:CYTH domain-containing protein n=1 Tax=Tropilaelaps mercedesae TaxID=418985 RepID=A0A1V9XSU6_9ACAR|nr:hypothetical protein BIW11_07714 [Tropilaelaps mercedesae]